MVRTLVGDRGTGPGPVLDRVLPCFSVFLDPFLDPFMDPFMDPFLVSPKSGKFHKFHENGRKVVEKWSKKCLFSDFLSPKPYPIPGALQTSDISDILTKIPVFSEFLTF